MILNFVLLSSVIVGLEARYGSKIEMFEIRENPRHGLNIKPVHDQIYLGSKLARLFPNLKKVSDLTGKERLASYVSDNYSDTEFVEDDDKSKLSTLSTLLELLLNKKLKPRDHVFEDPTRSERVVDSGPEVLYQLVPKINSVQNEKRLRPLRSQANVDDRTAAPRYKYNYDYEK